MRATPRSSSSVETIAAIATPAGRSSCAVLRISGPGAVEAVASLATAGREALEGCPGFGVVTVRLCAGSMRVPASVLVYRAPRSYTREELVELTVPGTPALLSTLLEALLARGRIRAAGPGEFTLRAFLSGRIDLSQAEAVAQLIECRGQEEATALRRSLGGELGRRVEQLRETLVETLALLEAALDFPDEDLPEVSTAGLTGRLKAVHAQLSSLTACSRLREGRADLLRVVLAGLPNAGKSSLFNVLVGRTAAISSPLPGTTRDPLRAVRTYGDRRIEWIDLAGMETLPGVVEGNGAAAAFGAAGSTDPALWEVVARLTRLELDGADRIVWVLDGSEDPSASLEQYERLPPESRLLVVQKTDLLEAAGLARWPQLPSGCIGVSARCRQGFDELLEAVLAPAGRPSGLRSGPGSADAAAPRFLLTSHQQAALSLAEESLARALLSVREEMGYEYAACDVRDVLRALEDLLGRVTPDVVLGHVFARFCIGK